MTAHIHFAVAAEIAEAGAKGPGGFAGAFVDPVHGVDEAAPRARAKIEPPVSLA